MKIFIRLLVMIVLILSTFNSRSYSQTSCSAPWFGITKSYIFSAQCTVKVHLCVYCHPEAPIVDIIAMGLSDVCPDVSAATIFQFVQWQVLNDYASFCGSKPCYPGPPLRINYSIPICVKKSYNYLKNSLSIYSCSNISGNNACYKEFDVCWNAVPFPGQISVTPIRCYTYGPSDCPGVEPPPDPKLPWLSDWESPECYEIECETF